MHLLLTNPNRNDLEEFHKMNQDPLLQREFHNLRSITLEKSEAMLLEYIRISESNSSENFCFIKVAPQVSPNDYYDITNSSIVGFISVNQSGDLDFQTSGFQILLNYAILEKYRNRGLMTQALNLRMKRFEELGFNILPAYIKGENGASEKVLRKCGFRRVVDHDLGSTFVKRITMDKARFEQGFPEV